jgi:hypothetical protein
VALGDLIDEGAVRAFGDRLVVGEAQRDGRRRRLGHGRLDLVHRRRRNHLIVHHPLDPLDRDRHPSTEGQGDPRLLAHRLVPLHLEHVAVGEDDQLGRGRADAEHTETKDAEREEESRTTSHAIGGSISNANYSTEKAPGSPIP